MSTEKRDFDKESASWDENPARLSWRTRDEAVLRISHDRSEEITLISNFQDRRGDVVRCNGYSYS
jgi:hypothetical protein